VRIDGTRITPATLAVLRALGAAHARWHHGYDVMISTGLKSGTLYPILMRLAERGYLETVWEDRPPTGRPARHLYRLTPNGRRLLREASAVTAAPSLRFGSAG